MVGFLILLMGGIRTDLNAARTSAAGDGSTEPLLDFIESPHPLPQVFTIYSANPENSIEKRKKISYNKGPDIKRKLRERCEYDMTDDRRGGGCLPDESVVS